MNQHGQTTFLIERLQPSWLRTRGERLQYALGIGLSTGVIGGLIAGFGRWQLFALTWGLLWGISRWWWWLLTIIMMLTLNIVTSRILGTQQTSTAPLLIALTFGLFTGLSLGLKALINFRRTPDNIQSLQIRLVEELRWSWKAALRGVSFGAVLGTAVILMIVLAVRLLGVLVPQRPTEVLLRTLVGALVIGWYIGLVLAISQGIEAVEIQEKDKENQPNLGIRRSALNALRVGVRTGAYLWIGLTSLFVLAVFLLDIKDAIPGLAEFAAYFDEGIRSVLSKRLISLPGLLAFCVAGAFVLGGFTCIQHLVLRLVLWSNKQFPLHYIDFLDYAADRLLVRRVGGSYIFIHNLLQEHFAMLFTEIGKIERSSTHGRGLIAARSDQTDSGGSD